MHGARAKRRRTIVLPELRFSSEKSADEDFAEASQLVSNSGFKYFWLLGSFNSFDRLSLSLFVFVSFCFSLFLMISLV